MLNALRSHLQWDWVDWIHLPPWKKTNLSGTKLIGSALQLDSRHFKSFRSYLPKLQIFNGWWRRWLRKPWAEIWHDISQNIAIEVGWGQLTSRTYFWFIKNLSVLWLTVKPDGDLFVLSHFLYAFAGNWLFWCLHCNLTWLSANLTQLWEIQSLPPLLHCCHPKTLTPWCDHMKIKLVDGEASKSDFSWDILFSVPGN